MKITLVGKVISKKNSKRVGVNKYTQRIYVSSSKAWKEFEEDALKQLLQFRAQGHFADKIKITYTFYFKGNQWLDVDNAVTGINDLLEDSTIIRNDRDIKEGHFFIIEGCKDWKTELEIDYVQPTTKTS